MNQAFHLARLQKVDLQIDHLNTRVREIDRLLKENTAIRVAEKNAREAEAEVMKWRQTLKSAENEVEAQRIKIELNEASLYGGKIHNPKELQDLQNDIASLKRHLSTLEDTQLNTMLALEESEAALQKASDQLVIIQGQFISQNAELAGERTKINENLLRLSGEREAALKPVTAESIAIYQRLREQKRGIAVALAEDGACTACGSGASPRRNAIGTQPQHDHLLRFLWPDPLFWITMFQNYKFDLISFLIGLAAGLLVWFLSTVLKRALPHLKALLRSTRKKIQDVATGGAARYVRFFVLKKAQKYHLASALFSLDEVVIPPRFLAQVNGENDSNSILGETYIPKIFPFLPDWPELVSQYNWPSLSAEEILQNGANVVIIGQPGSGKSVALAYLASKLARNDPALGSKANCIPLFLHVNELDNLAENPSLFENSVRIYASNAPFYIKSLIPGYFLSQARAGNLVMLIDGLDELNPADLSTFARLIAADQKSNPGLRLVLAASSDYLDGLLNLGFQPLPLASWNLNERLQFAKKWGQNWDLLISPLIRKKIPDYQISQLFIESWISFDSPCFTPMDWTLKLWSFYAGDASGPTTLHSLDSYLNRAVNQLIPVEALAFLALNNQQANHRVFTRGQAKAIFSSFKSDAGANKAHPFDNQSGSPSLESPGLKKPTKINHFSSNVIPQLADNGILIPVGEKAFYFAHPILLAYFASIGFTGELAQPNLEEQNPSDNLLFRYLAAQNRANSAIRTIVENSEPPLYPDLFTVCRWLKDSPLEVEWRSELMRKLLKLLMNQGLPLNLRPSVVSVLVSSNDPAVVTLFRQMLASPDDKLRILAALSCGALQDLKSIHEIAILFEDKEVDVRLAACLALGIFRSTASMTYITNTFLEGDDSLMPVAAEALAFMGEDGEALLRKGYESDSLVLRRAVVFGLSNVQQDWARQMLDKVSVQDTQWVVRDAARQVVESLNKPNSFIPMTLPAPSQASWLISYAARQGVGVPPGQVPIELLYSALDNGTDEEKIAAMDYLRLIPNSDVINKIYKLATKAQGAVKDASLIALWYLEVSGVRLSSEKVKPG